MYAEDEKKMQDHELTDFPLRKFDPDNIDNFQPAPLKSPENLSGGTKERYMHVQGGEDFSFLDQNQTKKYSPPGGKNSTSVNLASFSTSLYAECFLVFYLIIWHSTIWEVPR